VCELNTKCNISLALSYGRAWRLLSPTIHVRVTYSISLRDTRVLCLSRVEIDKERENFPI
jgi:hypothetical protein